MTPEEVAALQAHLSELAAKFPTLDVCLSAGEAVAQAAALEALEAA